MAPAAGAGGSARMTEFWLIRDAAADSGGMLSGRCDVGLNPARIAPMRLPAVAQVVSSPARRRRETAAHLMPDRAASADARLWEQDFGAGEQLGAALLADLGPLP